MTTLHKHHKNLTRAFPLGKLWLLKLYLLLYGIHTPLGYGYGQKPHQHTPSLAILSHEDRPLWHTPFKHMPDAAKLFWTSWNNQSLNTYSTNYSFAYSFPNCQNTPKQKECELQASILKIHNHMANHNIPAPRIIIGDSSRLKGMWHVSIHGCFKLRITTKQPDPPTPFLAKSHHSHLRLSAYSSPTLFSPMKVPQYCRTPTLLQIKGVIDILTHYYPTCSFAATHREIDYVCQDMTLKLKRTKFVHFVSQSNAIFIAKDHLSSIPQKLLLPGILHELAHYYTPIHPDEDEWKVFVWNSHDGIGKTIQPQNILRSIKYHAPESPLFHNSMLLTLATLLSIHPIRQELPLPKTLQILFEDITITEDTTLLLDKHAQLMELLHILDSTPYSSLSENFVNSLKLLTYHKNPLQRDNEEIEHILNPQTSRSTKEVLEHLANYLYNTQQNMLSHPIETYYYLNSEVIADEVMLDLMRILDIPIDHAIESLEKLYHSTHTCLVSSAHLIRQHAQKLNSHLPLCLRRLYLQEWQRRSQNFLDAKRNSH